MRTIKLNLESSTAQLIEQAAGILGISVSEFIVQSSLRRATEIVGEQTIIYLDGAAFDWFVEFLDNPPPPNEALLTLLNTPSPWDEPNPE